MSAPSKYIKRIEADHRYMRLHGMRCHYCDEIRGYFDFPISQKTNRATITKPCRSCREQGIKKKKSIFIEPIEPKPIDPEPPLKTKCCTNCDSEYPSSLLNVYGQCLICVAKTVQNIERKKQKLNVEECFACGIAKPLKSFSRPGVCLSCEKIMPISKCQHCEKKYKKDDMMANVSKTCIFCVVRRSEKIEIAKLTLLMKKNKGIASKILSFITQNEKELFA